MKKQLIRMALLVTAAAFMYSGTCSSSTPSQPSKPSNEIVLKNIQYIEQQYPGINPGIMLSSGMIDLLNRQEPNLQGINKTTIYDGYDGTPIIPIIPILPPINPYIVFPPDPDNFCGVAAALMVRSKSAKNTEIIPDSGDAIRQSFEALVDGLYKGDYGGGSINVNVNGLLYSDGRTGYQAADEQFGVTENVLRNVYMAQKYAQWCDYISIDRGFVTSISISCMPLDLALSSIWTNIESNREPAVVIADLNKILKIRDSIPLGTNVALHYIVIAGVRKNNGLREFYVFDPWETMRGHWYPESDLRTIMEVDSSYPLWLWYYASDPAKPGIANPCYVGLINSN
jgi:hypothetical protein